jgi:hypothetical protein
MASFAQDVSSKNNLLELWEKKNNALVKFKFMW